MATYPEVIDHDSIAQYERSAATPRQVGTIPHHNTRIDVRPVLSSINVPALVVHRTGDPLVPVELAGTSPSTSTARPWSSCP